MKPIDTPSRKAKFLDTYVATKDVKVAAEEAWPELPPNRREAMVNSILTLPQLTHKLDKNGLAVDKLIAKHGKLLDAKKKITIGGWVDEVDDTDVQLKALEIGYKLHQLLSPKKNEEAPTQVTVNLDTGKLAEVAKRLEAINSKMIPSRENIVDAEIRDL